jgi:acetyl esterase/lipase
MWLVLGLLILVPEIHTRAQQNYPPVIDCDQMVLYKQASGSNLRLWIFNPPGHVSGVQSPAIVFFFGGGWRGGNPTQFVPHCEYLASRGMVAMVADYRVASRHQVLAKDCVEDAKSAVRWIRVNAVELGIDPNRIAAGGGSAGGHLAASTAILPGFEGNGRNLDTRSSPDAMALFNPGLILSPKGFEEEWSMKLQERLEGRMGVELEQISPYHHIRKDLPPAIIFHGTSDSTVRYRSVEMFTEKMKELGNHCVLIGYEDAGHGFFNHGRNGNAAFISTMYYLDRFLVEQGWLIPPPEIRPYDSGIH